MLLEEMEQNPMKPKRFRENRWAHQREVDSMVDKDTLKRDRIGIEVQSKISVG